MYNNYGGGGGIAARHVESVRREEKATSDENKEAKETTNSVNASKESAKKTKLQRRVSFTDREPEVIERREEAETSPEDDAESKAQISSRPKQHQKPAKKVKHRTKRRDDQDQDQEKVDARREKRRSQPLGGELFEQVSTKLKEIAIQQHQQDCLGPLTFDHSSDNEQEEEDVAQSLLQGGAVSKPQIEQPQSRLFYPSPTVAIVPPQPQEVRRRPQPIDPDMAFEDLSSCGASGTTSSESSPPQKPKQNRNSGIFEQSRSSAHSSKRNSIVMAAAASPVAASAKSGSSKRNSLDGKTVQGLAQDLAAECAKAYALMESSLSKLTTEFGPFGGKGTKVSVSTSKHSRFNWIAVVSWD